MPGQGVFALEERPAAGLYTLAWLLVPLGFILLALALIASTPHASFGSLLFALAGLVALLLGFATAAGYQVVARRTRPAGAYRGPSPLLVLGFVLTLANLIGAALSVVLKVDLAAPSGFIVGVLVPLVGYLAGLTLLVVRTGALSWQEMLRLRPGGPIGRVGDLLVGMAAGIGIILPVVLGATVLAAILGVQPESPIPPITGGADALAVFIGAAVIAPVGEELFFRGFVYSAWRADLGPARALRRSALLFALVHIFNVLANPGTGIFEIGAEVLLQFAVILPAAFLLGFIYERRGLAASIGTHIAYNGGLLLLAGLASRMIG